MKQSGNEIFKIVKKISVLFSHSNYLSSEFEILLEADINIIYKKRIRSFVENRWRSFSNTLNDILYLWKTISIFLNKFRDYNEKIRKLNNLLYKKELFYFNLLNRFNIYLNEIYKCQVIFEEEKINSFMLYDEFLKLNYLFDPLENENGENDEVSKLLYKVKIEIKQKWVETSKSNLKKKVFGEKGLLSKLRFFNYHEKEKFNFDFTDFFDILRRFIQKDQTPNIETEFYQYKYTKVYKHEFKLEDDVEFFWKNNSEKFPLLSNAVLQLFSIPSGSACVERSFSKLRKITKDRFWMENESLEHAIILYYNGDIQNKFKNI